MIFREKILIEHFGHQIPRTINGNTPMHYAAQRGHKDCARAIMDTVEEEWEKFPTDCNANTPLHHAAEKGHLETCRMINEYIPENKNMKNEPTKRFWQHDVFIRQGEEDLIREIRYQPKVPSVVGFNIDKWN